MSGINLTDNVTNRLYKQDGGSGHLWIVDSFYSIPSCDLVNLNTGDRLNFGLGGLTDQSFKEAEELSNAVSQLLHNTIRRR